MRAEDLALDYFVQPAGRDFILDEDEFMTLPKDVLLFYFSLLKEVFRGYALRCRWQDPATNMRYWVPVPDVLRPYLHGRERLLPDAAAP